MPNKLIIVLSGKKQSGKDTCANFIRYKYNSRTSHRGGCKIYSFADPLKQFCIDVLGISKESCYGNDEQKNAKTHITWDGLPQHIKRKYAGYKWFNPLTWPKEKTGLMTGREIMQVFGTDVMRSWYNDVWALGTYSLIKNDGFELAVIQDARFPNEICSGKGMGLNVKTIRLARNIIHDNHPSEIALDHFEKEQYDLFVNNRSMTLDDQFTFIEPHVITWMEEAGII